MASREWKNRGTTELTVDEGKIAGKGGTNKRFRPLIGAWLGSVVSMVLVGRDGLVGNVARGVEWHRRGWPTANGELQVGGRRMASAGGDEWEYAWVRGGP
jgi:hypothetical protein